MKTGKKRLQGSFTIEAAWIMSLVLLSSAVVIREAGRIHDQTVGAMAVQEAAEKGRRRRGGSLEKLAEEAGRHMGLRLSFDAFSLTLRRRGETVEGSGRGGDWKHEIAMTRFRPERFLRRITLLETLREEDGN